MDDDKLLSRINNLVRKDIGVKLKLKEESEENRRDSLNRFAKYLVSVATHSVGVSASVIPYNTRQSHVLLYIMEMFNLNESDLNDMFITNNLTQTAISPNQKSSFRCKKFHSWRPEVVLRMSRPRLLDQNQLDNLSIRVYLFKEDQAAKLDAPKLNKVASKVEKSKQILEMIFTNSQLDPSILIRPVKELRSLIRFRSTIMENQSNPNGCPQLLKKFSMACTYRNMTILSDLRLPIRRYYCDPKVSYILRFEFWIDIKGTKRSCLRCVQSTFRAAIYNGVYNCLKKKDSIYMNENSDFYGFINLKLSKLPSYPFRKKVNILSLQMKEIDTCELVSDLRNRQLADDTELSTTYLNTHARKSNLEFQIRHMRLYVNCLLYQCIELSSHDILPPIQEITLDSLLYLPGHCLINQHRLQSNLTQYEDRCLRRVSILLLLVNLHEYRTVDHQIGEKFFLIIRYLIAIFQNEYLLAHRPLDDKTEQDIHLFERSLTNRKLRKKRDICELELTIIRSFMNKFLEPRVISLLSKPRTGQNELDRSITLNGMRSLRLSLDYLRKHYTGNSMGLGMQVRVRHLKSNFEAHLCSAILYELGSRIKEAIARERDNVKKMADSPWLQLLLEIKFINHNLRLNWSRNGLDSIFARELTKVETEPFRRNLRGLRSIVKVRLDEYLSS